MKHRYTHRDKPQASKSTTACRATSFSLPTAGKKASAMQAKRRQRSEMRRRRRGGTPGGGEGGIMSASSFTTVWLAKSAAYQDRSRGEWGDAFPCSCCWALPGSRKEFGASCDLSAGVRIVPPPPPATSYIASLRSLRVPSWRPSPLFLLAPGRDRFPRFSPRGYTASTASAGNCTQSSPIPCRSRRFSNTGEWDARRRSWCRAEGLFRGWVGER